MIKVLKIDTNRENKMKMKLFLRIDKLNTKKMKVKVFC